jgi:nucleotide-binding universal stress UspA family protein
MFKEILFAVDLNAPESQQKALNAAIAQAKLSKAKLHVITVVPDFGVGMVSSYFPENFEQNLMKDTTTRLHDYVKAHVPKGIPVQHIVAHGTIYREIIRYAAKVKVDLIVMASHRPELKDYLLGPNASHVVKHADCSVLVIRD